MYAICALLLITNDNNLFESVSVLYMENIDKAVYIIWKCVRKCIRMVKIDSLTHHMSLISLSCVYLNLKIHYFQLHRISIRLEDYFSVM